jgi:hypothetical protein
MKKNYKTKHKFYTHFSITLLLVLFFGLGCEKEEKQNGPSTPSPEGTEEVMLKRPETGTGFQEMKTESKIEQYVGEKVVLTGELTGEFFQHRVFFHPPFTEIAHFNLVPDEPLFRQNPHLVIYFKKGTDLDSIYAKFMNYRSKIHGTLGKVDGIFLEAEPEQIKNRRAHTIYYLDVEKIEKVDNSQN